MQKAEKITIKQGAAVDKEATSRAMQIIASVQDNVCNNIVCLLVALVAVIITVYILNYWMKKKDDNEGKEESECTSTKNKEGLTENDESDSSEADASEEDLPWLLQKPPGETSLTDATKKKPTDEKHSECSGSDKSQESVRMMKKRQGCGDSPVAAGVKVITANDDYVYMDE